MRRKLGSNKEIRDEIETKQSGEFPPIFFIFRVIGMILVVGSSVFLFNGKGAPIIPMFQNGPLGNIILAIGVSFFGLYFVFKLYYSFKSKK